MINLNTCKFCLWGFKNSYHTYGHVHEAYYRTLKAIGKEVFWIDSETDIRNIDFSNTFFLTQNDVLSRDIDSIPLRKDCFYAVHNSIQGGRDRFDNLDWMAFGNYLRKNPHRGPVELLLAPDTPFYWDSKTVDFFFATNLLPNEIQANKPSRVFRSDSRVVNWVASSWQGATQEMAQFRRACSENQIAVEWYGQGKKGIVSVEENVRLIQESYIAPALVSPEQYKMGYLPCRIFKNISYGQYGVVNSEFINDVFDGKLICNQDCYRLFYDARERLPGIQLADLHSLMDYVAENHTYLNRFDALLKAARLVLENK